MVLRIFKQKTKDPKFKIFKKHIWAPRQPPLTFDFGLVYIFLFIYRTLSLRQKTKNIPNQGSNDKNNGFFGPVRKSHTQMGSLSAKNASKKFSRLGTFKEKEVERRPVLYRSLILFRSAFGRRNFKTCRKMHHSYSMVSQPRLT
jgi:hypothetical protein